MRAAVLNAETIFDNDHRLRDGAADFLHILKNLGVRVGVISDRDHRVLAALDDAGVRRFISDVVCSDSPEAPRSPEAFAHLLGRLGVDPDHTTLIGHTVADIALGKIVGVDRTIGIGHELDTAALLRQAGADSVVSSVPDALGVLE